jgi:hypothetical protein
VAYANKGSRDDVNVGNWDNQKGYDEERADNEDSANRADVEITAGSETGKNKKEDVAVRRKFL